MLRRNSEGLVITLNPLELAASLYGLLGGGIDAAGVLVEVEGGGAHLDYLFSSIVFQMSSYIRFDANAGKVCLLPHLGHGTGVVSAVACHSMSKPMIIFRQSVQRKRSLPLIIFLLFYSLLFNSSSFFNSFSSLVSSLFSVSFRKIFSFIIFFSSFFNCSF